VGPPAESTWTCQEGGGLRFADRPGALDALHRRYQRRLEAVAYRILGDRSDAEDVVQRVFLRLPGARFRGDSSVWTYLYRAAVNMSVNVLRSRRRRERLERHLAAGAEPLAPVGAAPAPASADSRVLEGEILAGVARALLRVKAQHRRVLVMRIVWGLSNAEIARREDIPLATVGTWLRRGRAELVKEMGPLLSELEADRS
jgi:RNA polymerase sigma-70 factor (ECF subfamily)